MPLDPANNLAETELTASVSDTATTLPVADASVFPDADTEGAFNVLVWDASANINPSDAPDAEFVRVTSVDTAADELTVERGQEDTTASAKADGSTVADTFSVKDRDDIESGIAGKADDPHGSESHSSEVVHEGEDAAFGETTHDSVSTDDIVVGGQQSNIHWELIESGTLSADGSFSQMVDTSGHDELRLMIDTDNIDEVKIEVGGRTVQYDYILDSYSDGRSVIEDDTAFLLLEGGFEEGFIDAHLIERSGVILLSATGAIGANFAGRSWIESGACTEGSGTTDSIRIFGEDNEGSINYEIFGRDKL